MEVAAGGPCGGAVIGCCVGVGVRVWLSSVVVVLSLHPQNLPGVSHVVVAVGMLLVLVVVVVDVVLSLHPNHPGVLHVEVVVVEVVVVHGVVVVVVVDVAVVVSSKHPHQPVIVSIISGDILYMNK